MQGLLAFRDSMDVRDIAAVAALALARNSEGKSYALTGPEALTHAEMASQLSQVLGKQITFVGAPETAMRDALLGFALTSRDLFREADYA